MDNDEEDNFYATEDAAASATVLATETTTTTAPSAPAATKSENEDLEEGEEEDEAGEMYEENDSDIDIVTERKDPGLPPLQSKYSEIRNIPQRSTTSDMVSKPAPVKEEGKPPSVLESYAPVLTSRFDVNAIPIHKDTGKPITQVNIDEDLSGHEKPWRKPGTDISDYFNYGFDEFTWALYAQKQEALRAEFNPELVAQTNKKMMEDMTHMMMGGIFPSAGGPGSTGTAGGGSAGGGGGGGSLPAGMEGMPPEMQAMMQQMMASGMDPSQMADPTAMAAMFGSGSNAGGQGGQGNPGQNFGGAGAFGGNQGQGSFGGYEQQMGGGGSGGNRGNFGGRGRSGRRNWQ